jgi:hypothetical protein
VLVQWSSTGRWFPRRTWLPAIVYKATPGTLSRANDRATYRHGGGNRADDCRGAIHGVASKNWAGDKQLRATHVDPAKGATFDELRHDRIEVKTFDEKEFGALAAADFKGHHVGQ